MFAFSFNFFFVGFHLIDILHLSLLSALSWDLSVSSQPISKSLDHLFLSALACPWFPLVSFFPLVLVVFSPSLPSLALSVVLLSVPPHPLSPPPYDTLLFFPHFVHVTVLPSHPSLVLFMVPPILFFQVLSPVFA